MPRFVILDHDHPFPHRDLMLEADGRLRTWRLVGDPLSDRPIAAEPLGDHRIDYLDYEGPVSGGRGSVSRWDGGEYKIAAESPIEIALELTGMKCRGSFRLSRSGGNWTWRHSRPG